MKTKYFIFFALLQCSLMKMNGQSIVVPEPEFIGAILLVAEDGSTSQKLEKQTASAAAKADLGAALLGLTKGKGVNKVFGFRSPIRVPSGQIVRLIVRAQDIGRDPAEIVNVFKMESDSLKDNRTVVVGKVSTGSSTTMDIRFLPFEGSKYGEHCYLIELSNLSSGEYAVTLDGTRMIFNLFGVD